MSLEVKSLTKIYGSQKALDGVSFAAHKGRILGFLGPNGAGKSTTMKIATGYILPTEGDVSVNGLSAVAQPKAVSQVVGYLPEHNPLYLDMYVKEFLAFSGGLFGLKGKPLQNRVDELVGICGLSIEAHKRIHQLSKGYRQRVGLAKALIHDPEVIILDEPTTGLDPNQLQEIRKLIKEISREKTLILSTHIMQEVEALCDDVVIINRGKIVAADSLDELKKGSGKSRIRFETEEALEKSWFEALGEVSFGNNQHQVSIFTEDPAACRKTILGIVTEKGLNLVSIKQEERNLEAIFRQITQNQEAL